MKTRTEILAQIRHESLNGGLAAALQTARTAFTDGRLDRFDLPEVFLALRTGSWRFLRVTDDLNGWKHGPEARAA